MITGFANGDQADVKTSLEDSIREYDDVDSFEVDVEEVKPTHCKSCGEWLDGAEMCPECGRIQLDGY